MINNDNNIYNLENPLGLSRRHRYPINEASSHIANISPHSSPLAALNRIHTQHSPLFKISGLYEFTLIASKKVCFHTN